MKRKIGRYSKYLRPITITFDLIVLVFLAIIILPEAFQHFYFYLYLGLSWIVISLITKFYQVYRFTKLIQIAQKVIAQFFIYSVILLAFNGLFSYSSSYEELAIYLGTTSLIIVSIKYLIFYLLKIFRKYYKGNLRKIVVVGDDELTQQFVVFVTTNLDYGYALKHHFSLEKISTNKITTYCC